MNRIILGIMTTGSSSEWRPRRQSRQSHDKRESGFEPRASTLYGPITYAWTTAYRDDSCLAQWSDRIITSRLSSTRP